MPPAAAARAPSSALNWDASASRPGTPAADARGAPARRPPPDVRLTRVGLAAAGITPMPAFDNSDASGPPADGRPTTIHEPAADGRPVTAAAEAAARPGAAEPMAATPRAAAAAAEAGAPMPCAPICASSHASMGWHVDGCGRPAWTRRSPGNARERSISMPSSPSSRPSSSCSSAARLLPKWRRCAAAHASWPSPPPPPSSRSPMENWSSPSRCTSSPSMSAIMNAPSSSSSWSSS